MGFIVKAVPKRGLRREEVGEWEVVDG